MSGMPWDLLVVTQNNRPCLAGMILEKDSIRKIRNDCSLLSSYRADNTLTNYSVLCI